MPDQTYIVYPDQTPGWENTTWKFFRSYHGEKCICPEGEPFTMDQSYNFSLNEGTQVAYDCYERNANISYRTPSGYGDALVCAHLQYNDPTNGIAGIIINGYWKIDDTTVGQMNLTMSSASSGELKTSDGTVISIPDNVNILQGINRGATMPLVSSSTEGWYGARQDRTNTMVINLPIPVFENYNALKAYILNNDISGCINLADKYDMNTKPYFIYNQYGVGKQLRGSVTPQSNLSWRSMKLLCNKVPMLYYDANGYGLTLKPGGVVSSVSLDKPGYLLDLVPQEQWTDGLAYDGKFWGTFASRNAATGKILPDGTYSYYGFSLSTNILIFKDKAAADNAEATGDYSEAVNYEELENRGKKVKPTVGPDAGPTEFGNGADTSPFMNMYAMSRTTIAAIANQWYNTDGQILQNILDGLKMYSNPTDAIAGLTWYPFDLSDILVTSSQNFINFGSYQMSLTGSVDHVDGMKSGAYLDCGSIFLEPLFYSYRDYPPYTSLSVFLPFIGWRDIDIRPLIGKNVSIRYYVDVHTRSCTACILANGVFIYQFDGTIGVSLPISAPDFQGYANSALNAILGGAKDMIGIGNTAAQVGGSAGPVGAAAVAALGTGVNTTKTMFELEKLGQPRDHLITRGAFTSGIGAYLPKTIYWRYDIHQPMEPADFNALYGRPSTASGTVGSFSGFLKCKTAKLNTGGMLDAEADEVAQLLKSGVFV